MFQPLYMMSFHRSHKLPLVLYLTPAVDGRRSMSPLREEADLLTRNDADILLRLCRETYPGVQARVMPANHSVGFEAYGPPRPRAVPKTKVFIDADHLIARGFTEREAGQHYSWVQRHRMLATRRADPKLTLRRLGEIHGVSPERIRQQLDKAKREERHPSGHGGQSDVAKYLLGHSLRRAATSLTKYLAHGERVPELARVDRQLEMFSDQ